jgi:hypothetical protein
MERRDLEQAKAEWEAAEQNRLVKFKTLTSIYLIFHDQLSQGLGMDEKAREVEAAIMLTEISEFESKYVKAKE